MQLRVKIEGRREPGIPLSHTRHYSHSGEDVHSVVLFECWVSVEARGRLFEIDLRGSVELWFVEQTCSPGCRKSAVLTFTRLRTCGVVTGTFANTTCVCESKRR